jgi:uncharacterized protein (TIGR02284 family)
MFDNDDDKTVLNTLTATLNDSVNGYREAAEHAEDRQLKELFRRSADERSQIANDLRDEVRRQGGNPDDDGTLLGKTHQRFLDLKAAIAGRDDKAIVNEVERGEDYLKAKFKAAAESDALSAESRAVVEQVYQLVLRGHDRVSKLKHSMEANG